MSVEKVKNYLKQWNKDGDVQEFDTSSATVELAAAALGVDGAQIAKSIAFAAEDGCVLVVCAGDVKIDNKKFKDTFGMKAKMLSREETLAQTGYAVGGVCPFDCNSGVKVFGDVSLKRFDRVYPACGSANSAIGLSTQELYELGRFEKWVDVCKAITPKA